MPNLWGHWTNLNQTWTHIHLWPCYLKNLVQTPPGIYCARPGSKKFPWDDFELWLNISLQGYLPIWPSGQRTWPPCAVEHDALSGRGSRLSSGTTAYQRIISNNSYAHDEQGVNPEQVRGFDGVFCKLWPSLMPWLAASMCQSCWRESQSRQMWLSFLARRWRSVSQGWHWISASPGLASQ